MRDAATRARTREKHDTKTQLKNKSTKPAAPQPPENKKGPDTQHQASSPSLPIHHAYSASE